MIGALRQPEKGKTNAGGAKQSATCKRTGASSYEVRVAENHDTHVADAFTIKSFKFRQFSVEVNYPIVRAPSCAENDQMYNMYNEPDYTDGEFYFFSRSRLPFSFVVV